MESLRGKLLIAAPTLAGPQLRAHRSCSSPRTTRRARSGSILNRPLEVPLADDLPRARRARRARLDAAPRRPGRARLGGRARRLPRPVAGGADHLRHRRLPERRLRPRRARGGRAAGARLRRAFGLGARASWTSELARGGVDRRPARARRALAGRHARSCGRPRCGARAAATRCSHGCPRTRRSTERAPPTRRARSRRRRAGASRSPPVGDERRAARPRRRRGRRRRGCRRAASRPPACTGPRGSARAARAGRPGGTARRSVGSRLAISTS